MEKEEKRADQENDTEEQSTEAKSLLKKKLQYYSSEIQRDVGNLVKWLMIAVLVGCITGAASTLFSFVLKSVTNCRKENEWMFYLLPVMGLIIVYLYEKFGKDDGGTNQVLSTVRSQDDVPILSAPLIFISTALTHLAGGSAGREGAAIQLGGSIANQLGSNHTRHQSCIIHHSYTDYLQCKNSRSHRCSKQCRECCTHTTHNNYMSVFLIQMNPTSKLTIETGLKMGAIAVGCAVISIVFCMVLNGVAGAYGRWFKNPYVRVVVGSCLVIGITLLLGTSDYMGAGAELIEKAVEEGQARPLDFFWKLVLTALTMRAGFRGGEIVPSFCIGATFGCMMGNWLGLSPSICAACGMAAVFCGVTNCPITSILIAFEMFGFKGVSFYLIAVSISYAASGYYGLYKDQTIVYSKYKAKYVNKRTRF